MTTLNAISNEEFSSREVVKLLSDNVVQDGWYGHVVYLGKE
ncbi:hypothetical protein A2U01_0069784, partial [Trifolium medium]|nr:hypothetical protein [Trifolium medium]